MGLYDFQIIAFKTLENIGYISIPFLLIIITYWIYKRYVSPRRLETNIVLPNLPRRDFTIEELRKYDGSEPDGRILIAVNGNVFDVTNNGLNIYGKGAPYHIFAGRDASRGLATFKNDPSVLSDECDDLSDLSSDNMSTLREWGLQFRERYYHVGRLLSPSETHHIYECDDESTQGEVDTSVLKN